MSTGKAITASLISVKVAYTSGPQVLLCHDPNQRHLIPSRVGHRVVGFMDRIIGVPDPDVQRRAEVPALIPESYIRARCKQRDSVSSQLRRWHRRVDSFPLREVHVQTRWDCSCLWIRRVGKRTAG